MNDNQPKWFVLTKSWIASAVPAALLMLPLLGVALSPEQVAGVNEFVAAFIGLLSVGLGTWGTLARTTTTTFAPPPTPPANRQSGSASAPFMFLLTSIGVFALALAFTGCSMLADKPNQTKIWTAETIDVLSGQIDIAETRNWIASDDEIRLQGYLLKAVEMLRPGALPDPDVCKPDDSTAECRLRLIQAAEKFYLEHKPDAS